MLSYTLGPFLALLPKRWRDSLPISASVHRGPAMILSGLAESAVALLALVFWYSYSVTHWAADAVFSAIQHGAEIDPRAIGFAGLAITCLHPFTWVIAYFGVEGIVRLGAAFTDTSLGILPLFLADKAYLKLRRRDAFHRSAEDNSARGIFASGIRSLREHALLAASPVTPDELCVTKSGSEEVLEIRACRAKPDWTPPRIVRHEDRYYRLEACSPGPAPRSFRYTLRRLSAGVPGRTVLVYSPDQTPQVADH